MGRLNQIHNRGCALAFAQPTAENQLSSSYAHDFIR
ncbi:hypothetical protein SAMN05216604_1521 [Pseudomonas agarici]|nr:hypothetical protein SAMN05216604_1521 [Pseudomonas agarici]